MSLAGNDEVSGRWVNDQEAHLYGDLVATLTVSGRADLTDAQWAVLEPLLPRGRKPGRPVKWTKRQLIDGIRWRVRAGAPWRDVPPGGRVDRQGHRALHRAGQENALKRPGPAGNVDDTRMLGWAQQGQERVRHPDGPNRRYLSACCP